MENCLLCLDINKKDFHRIKVNSIQWRKQNMKYLIEKHFWALETLEPSSWICTTCWQELFNFHIFYLRIEEVHSNLVALIEETDDEITLEDQNYQSDSEDYINPEDGEVLNGLEESLVSHLPSKETDAPNKTKAPRKDPIKEDTDASELFKEAIISFDSPHDSDTNSEYGQNETTSEPRSKTHKASEEDDEFIAANFQLCCDLCQISVENFSALRTHFIENHNSYGYAKCCEKKIVNRSLLVDHIHVHLNPDYFKCEHCDRALSTRTCFEIHMKSHKDVQKYYPFSCDICGKNYKQQSTFENHKLTHKNKKVFSCTECGKLFSTGRQLSSHKRGHSLKYLKVCEICGKTIRNRNAFVSHMNIHENKQPTPLNCDICGLQLTNITGLRGHKKRQHPEDGIKEYPCHICAKVSPNPRALRIHILFAHEKGYDHKCTMCDKAFKIRKSLREHIATHTGIALYTCPWCPKSFISNSNMYKHRKKSHPMEWEEAQRQKNSIKFPSNYKPPVDTNINNLLQ